MGVQSHVSQVDGVIPPEQFFQPRICEGGNCPVVTHQEVAPGEFRSIANPDEVLYAHDYKHPTMDAGFVEQIEEHVEHIQVPIVSGSNAPHPEQQPALYVGAVQEVDMQRAADVQHGPEEHQREDPNAEHPRGVDLDADAHAERQEPEEREHAPVKRVARKKGKRGRKKKKKSDRKGWF